MAFLRFRKKLRAPADTGRTQKAKRTIKRVPPVAMEVKVLAIEALATGLSAEEVGELRVGGLELPVCTGPSAFLARRAQHHGKAYAAQALEEGR